MNVGTGRGGSVSEVIKLMSVRRLVGVMLWLVEEGRRAGDPAFLCADVSLIKTALGFSSKFSLEVSAGSLF
jgi:UDP-glucose 4-epimerase